MSAAPRENAPERVWVSQRGEASHVRHAFDEPTVLCEEYLRADLAARHVADARREGAEIGIRYALAYVWTRDAEGYAIPATLLLDPPKFDARAAYAAMGWDDTRRAAGEPK